MIKRTQILYWLCFISLVFINTTNAQDTKIEKKIARFDKRKWTVCSVTINSDDEIKVLKRKLPADQFNFVELTDFAKIELPKKIKRKTIEVPSEEGWFEKACESKVECHVLVISGHFTPAGRTFYGSSPYKLSLKSLQSQSCSETCSGILSTPLEVYLFGCDTLNNTCNVGLTDEQLRAQERQMISQGGDPERTRLLLSSLKETMGKSVKDTMKEIFTGVKSLYGFDGIAPSGKLAKGPLETTIENIEKTEGSYTAHLEKKLLKMGTTLTADDVHKNATLADAFKHTVLTQCSSEKVFLDDTIQYTSGVKSISCGLIDTRRSREDRFRILRDLVAYKKVLDYLPAVSNFLSTIKEPYSEEEQIIINKIKNDSELKKQFLSLTESLPLSSTLEDTLSIAVKLGWLSPAEKNKLFLKQLGQVLQQEIHTDSSRDYICALSKNKTYKEVFDSLRNTPPESIATGLRNTSAGLDTLSCMRVYIKAFIPEIRSTALTSTDPRMRSSALDYLVKTNAQDPETIKVFIQLMRDKNMDTRQDVFYSLKETFEEHPEIVASYADNLSFKKALFSALEDSRNQNVNYQLDQVAFECIVQLPITHDEAKVINESINTRLLYGSQAKAIASYITQRKQQGDPFDFSKLARSIIKEIDKLKQRTDSYKEIYRYAMLLKAINRESDQKLADSILDLSFFSSPAISSTDRMGIAQEFSDLKKALPENSFTQTLARLLKDGENKYSKELSLRQGRSTYIGDHISNNWFYSELFRIYLTQPNTINEDLIAKVISGHPIYSRMDDYLDYSIEAAEYHQILAAHELRTKIVQTIEKIHHPSAKIQQAIHQNLDLILSDPEVLLWSSDVVIDPVFKKYGKLYADPALIKKTIRASSEVTRFGLIERLRNEVLTSIDPNQLIEFTLDAILESTPVRKTETGLLTFRDLFRQYNSHTGDHKPLQLTPGSKLDLIFNNPQLMQKGHYGDHLATELGMSSKVRFTKESHEHIYKKAKETKNVGYWNAIGSLIDHDPEFEKTYGSRIAQLCRAGISRYQFPFSSLQLYSECKWLESKYPAP